MYSSFKNSKRVSNYEDTKHHTQRMHMALSAVRVFCVGFGVVCVLTDWLVLSASCCLFCLKRRWYCLFDSLRLSARGTRGGPAAAAAAGASAASLLRPQLGSALHSRLADATAGTSAAAAGPAAAAAAVRAEAAAVPWLSRSPLGSVQHTKPSCWGALLNPIGQTAAAAAAAAASGGTAARDGEETWLLVSVPIKPIQLLLLGACHAAQGSACWIEQDSTRPSIADS
jgi:hypothetical protein